MNWFTDFTPVFCYFIVFMLIFYIQIALGFFPLTCTIKAKCQSNPKQHKDNSNIIITYTEYFMNIVLHFLLKTFVIL